MGKKLKGIPNFSSWEEEDEFWSTHSVTELDLEEDTTPLVVEPGALRKVVKKYKDYLSAKHPERHKAFSDLEKSNPESARAEAVLFFLLKSQNFDVTIYEDPSTGGADLLCKTSQDTFLVEVTCLEADTVAEHSGLKEGPDSGWSGLITNLLRTKASKKARQLSNAPMPRLLAIAMEPKSVGISMIFQAESLLTSDTEIRVQPWPYEPNVQIGTDLDDSVFFRFSKSGTIEVCRQSISAILLVQILAYDYECRIVGILHPQPVFKFPIRLLPTVPFVRVCQWPPVGGKIETERVIWSPSPARLFYNRAFKLKD